MSFLQTIDDYFCCTLKLEEIDAHRKFCDEFYNEEDLPRRLNELESDRKKFLLFGKYIPNFLAMTSICICPAGLVLSESLRNIVNIYYLNCIKNEMEIERNSMITISEIEDSLSLNVN